MATIILDHEKPSFFKISLWHA